MSKRKFQIPTTEATNTPNEKINLEENTGANGAAQNVNQGIVEPLKELATGGETGGVQEPAKTETKNPLESSNELLKSLSGYTSELPTSELSEVKKRSRRTKEQMTTGAPPQQVILIPPSLFTTVCDHVVTGAFGWLDTLISKDPIDTSVMRLTDKQIKDLDPLAEAVIKELKISDRPIEAFVYSLLAIHTMNYMTLKQLAKIEKMKTKKQNQ